MGLGLCGQQGAAWGLEGLNVLSQFSFELQLKHQGPDPPWGPPEGEDTTNAMAFSLSLWGSDK